MKYISVFLFLFLVSCGEPVAQKQLQEQAENSADRPLAKFEPASDQCLLFVGQELEAIGGLKDYNDGYLDHYNRPAGFTMYTNLNPGLESFGRIMEGLDGVFKTADWGDSPSNMSLQLDDSDFENMALAIGLQFVHHEEKVADGTHDALIKKMGKFFLSLGERPVFLRIGYEFDGYSWNHYEIEPYKKAYRRIKDKLDEMGVNNVAYVWQSTGWVTSLDLLEDWYPGDDYVDWCGYSFFARWDEAVMIDFARKKGKPVFIAEATPTISDYTIKFNGDAKTTLLSDPAQAKEAWDKWFIPFFNTIEENKDIVKAISYINCHWKNHVMWKGNPTFKDVDARLHINQEISNKWKEKVYTDAFIHSSDDLYQQLWRK